MKPLTEKAPTMTEAHRDVFRQAEVHSFTAREAEFAHEKMRDIRDNIASQVRGDSLNLSREMISEWAHWLAESDANAGEVSRQLFGLITEKR